MTLKAWADKKFVVKAKAAKLFLCLNRCSKSLSLPQIVQFEETSHSGDADICDLQSSYLPA